VLTSDRETARKEIRDGGAPAAAAALGSAAAALRARRGWEGGVRGVGLGVRFIGRRGGAEAVPRAVELDGAAAGH
jgi:hypothetical protein